MGTSLRGDRMRATADSTGRRSLALSLVALIAALLFAAQVYAYTGQNPYIVDMKASDNNPRCDAQIEVTVTVRDAESGVLVAEQGVQWDFKKKAAPGDSVKPGFTVTDENGRSSATVQFGNAEGKRTVRVNIATWPTTLAISCTGGVTATPPPTPKPTPKPTLEPTARPPSNATATPGPGQHQPSTSPGATAEVTAQPTSATTPAPVATPLAVSTPAATAPAPGTTEVPPPSSAAPTSSAVALATPSTGAPAAATSAPSMGLATFGLIGLIGLVVGGATFFYLRRR